MVLVVFSTDSFGRIILTNTRAERSHGATTGPVAVDLLNENVIGRALDSNTLVLVGDLDIVNPDVGAPNIDSVQTTLVSTADDHVVQFTIGASVERQVECRS